MKEFPADWPQEGPIDLAIHDLPHASSTTEWWYVNTHLTLAEGRAYSLFASFFRMLIGHDKETKEAKYAHSLTWALIDPEEKVYTALSYVDKRAPEIGKEKIKRGEGTKDKRLRRAMKEVLDKGKVPYPDQMFKADPIVQLDTLHIDFDGNSYTKQDDGTYKLKLYHEHFKTGCELVFHVDGPPQRHGHNGVVQGAAGEDMFYYFLPHCHVTGHLVLEGKPHEIVDSKAWYDHEFGAPLATETDSEGALSVEVSSTPVEGEDPAGPLLGTGESKFNMAWNWCSVQFDDGHALSAYELHNLDNDNPPDVLCLLIAPDGQVKRTQDFEFTPSGRWTSTRTFHSYPTQWALSLPEFEIDLTLEGSFVDQEFITLISKPAFWEGRIDAKGTWGGKPVSGIGFIERSGFHMVETLDDFFVEVGKETRKSVRSLIPFEPTQKQVLKMIANDTREDLMEGVDTPQLVRTMVAPVREITDRGGKSWRSYAALACCDVVGGDSRHYVQWLAMPEMMHVGSLIVDDVQDRSTWRRGGKACHMIYGEPLAINAGTACYFMGQKILINKERTSDKDQLRLYDLYFLALRAGHAGQALDLEGPIDIMDEVVESGECADLELRVLAVHKMKTAVPAGALARMGGVAGGGTDEQIEALGFFFESVGLAFQIIDDVLNLRGFKRDLKSRGEDIMHGKITIPVAKAMGLMPKEERAWLWETLQSHPTDFETVGICIDKIEACGALDACVDQANDLVEIGWKTLDPIVEDSLQKLMLRAFSWYVLERHY